MSARFRLVLTFALLSSWLVLLMSGWAAGGFVHLLLLVALAVFPWRRSLDSDDSG